MLCRHNKNITEEVHVSKMIKLLTLVAVVGMIVLPTLALAQEKVAPAAGTPVGEKPYANGAEIKAWANVKAGFMLGDAEVSIPGFAVKRVVTTEPEGQFFYKENNTYWTWKEGYAVVAPTDAKDLGYFTIRYGDTPKPKIYKATAPATPAAPKTPEPVKTGWKRGTESVRSK
jgi:hypothetical protein